MGNIKKISLLILCFILITPWQGSKELSAQDKGQQQKSNEDTYVPIDAKREEIQRYFGYELLLYRYLSAPYDVSINTTQSGNFVDIGFLLIMLLPLLLLFKLRSRKWLFWSFLLYLIFLLVISMSNSFVFSHTKAKVGTTLLELDNYLAEVNFSSEPLSQVSAKLHQGALILYKPLEKLGLTISGDTDGITYPFLFIIFCLISTLLLRLTKNMKRVHQYFLGFSWIYGFYWWVFGGGIIWYGYILLPTLYFLIALILNKLENTESRYIQSVKYLFYGLGVIWICMGAFDRISNIQPNVPEADLGKGMFSQVFLDYNCGKFDRSQTADKIFPKITNTMNQINQDKDALVWRVGTTMTYFIDDNQRRVLTDNQLGIFRPLRFVYKDDSELVEVMKASKFKYLIIDLNTAMIDQTPQKTLTKKYNDLMSFVKGNNKLKLLATDRIVAQNENGSAKYYYRVFGQIYYPGTYAIYELI